MKIYTITCHRAYNYGAVLQTYALQKYLANNGYEVETIDYYPPYLRKISAKYEKNIFAIVIRKLVYAADYSKSKKVFNTFVERNIRLTARCKKMKDIKELPAADYYVVGSDQVWNPYLRNGLDDCYYLNSSQFEGKKIAYAASIGVEIFDEYEEFILERLEGFKNISVRERISRQKLEELGRKVELVMDPAYLLDASEWDEISETMEISDKYILVYALHHIQEIYDYAKKLGEKFGAKVYVINVEYKEKRRGGDKFFWNVSVGKFITLIAKADAVVTNSFHGIAFANIYRKPIHIFDTESNDVRVSGIIQQLQLVDRVCCRNQDTVLENVVSQRSLEKMEKESDKSKGMLLSWLE